MRCVDVCSMIIKIHVYYRSCQVTGCSEFSACLQVAIYLSTISSTYSSIRFHCHMISNSPSFCIDMSSLDSRGVTVTVNHCREWSWDISGIHNCSLACSSIRSLAAPVHPRLDRSRFYWSRNLISQFNCPIELSKNVSQSSVWCSTWEF